MLTDLTRIETAIKNLKTELIAHAYGEHSSPHMRRAILSSLQHAGLFNGDVDAEVAKHPNYTREDDDEGWFSGAYSHLPVDNDGRM